MRAVTLMVMYRSAADRFALCCCRDVRPQPVRMTLNSTIKSLARKLSTPVAAMADPQPAAQKSHYTHAERHEQNFDPVLWQSQLQARLHAQPPGKQDPKHLHLQSLYDPDYFPQLDNDAKETAEAIRNVSFPRSRSSSANSKHIGDMPAGRGWDGRFRGIGFDPMPNKEEWKVL